MFIVFKYNIEERRGTERLNNKTMNWYRYQNRQQVAGRSGRLSVSYGPPHSIPMHGILCSLL